MRPCSELAGDPTQAGTRVQTGTLGGVYSWRTLVGYRAQRYKSTEELNAQFSQHASLTGVTDG